MHIPQEEANCHICVHAIVPMAISPTQQSIHVQQLWLMCAQSQSLWLIDIHHLNRTAGLEKVKDMLFFNAFASCDVVSVFKTTDEILKRKGDHIADLGQFYRGHSSNHLSPNIEEDDIRVL